MKKTLLLSLFSFALGTGLTLLIITDPFGFHLVHRIQAGLGISHDTPAEEGSGRLWTCGMHPEVIRDEPGTCPICQMPLTPLKSSGPAAGQPSAARKVKYWQAPMDPTFMSDKPGKSPMGMDLIPVYEDEVAEPTSGTVQIDPVFVQNIGVQSTAVERKDIPFTVRTIGNLTYNDRQIAVVTTKYAGWIEKVYVNYVGEPVDKKQKLFEIYSPDLVNTQKEYLAAVDYAERMSQSSYPDMAKRAASLLDSTRQRLGYWDVTDEQIRQLEETRQVQRTLAVFSPVSGLVVEKMNQALEGMRVQPGMNLYKIVDLSTIWVDAEVFESQVPWLQVGNSARIEMPYQPGRVYRGTIRYLYPFLSDRSRTLKISIELPNPGWKLRADMYADVIFEVPSAKGVLTVPEESVIHSGTRNIVVLDQGNGTFQVKEIELGLNGNGLWEVKDGLMEGDQVVVSSQFLIDSESNLREAIQKMISRQENPDQGGTMSMPRDNEKMSVPGHQH